MFREIVTVVPTIRCATMLTTAMPECLYKSAQRLSCTDNVAYTLDKIHWAQSKQIRHQPKRIETRSRFYEVLWT